MIEVVISFQDTYFGDLCGISSIHDQIHGNQARFFAACTASIGKDVAKLIFEGVNNRNLFFLLCIALAQKISDTESAKMKKLH